MIKWNEKLENVLSDELWKKSNDQFFRLTNDTILQTFQFKINNRILYTNDKLYKFKIIETELCNYCCETRETLFHHLWGCNSVKNIWLKFKIIFNDKLNTSKALQPALFIFNIYQGNHSDLINFSILLFKRYIYIYVVVQKYYQLLNKLYLSWIIIVP